MSMFWEGRVLASFFFSFFPLQAVQLGTEITVHTVRLLFMHCFVVFTTFQPFFH